MELIVGEPITLEKESESIIFQAPNGIKYKAGVVGTEWHVSSVDASFSSVTWVHIVGNLIIEKEQDGSVRVSQIGSEYPYIMFFPASGSISTSGGKTSTKF